MSTQKLDNFDMFRSAPDLKDLERIPIIEKSLSYQATSIISSIQKPSTKNPVVHHQSPSPPSVPPVLRSLPSAPSRVPSAAAGRRPLRPRPGSVRSPPHSAPAAAWGAASGGRPRRGRPAPCPWSREGSSPTKGGRGLAGLDLGFWMCLHYCFAGVAVKVRKG